MSFVHVSGAVDLELIIQHFPPERTQITHYNPHPTDTHCLEHRCTHTAQTHTCASESNVALVTSVLEGIILGLLPRQPGAAHCGHAHTSHLPQNISYSRPFLSEFLHFHIFSAFLFTVHPFYSALSSSYNFFFSSYYLFFL